MCYFGNCGGYAGHSPAGYSSACGYSAGPSPLEHTVQKYQPTVHSFTQEPVHVESKAKLYNTGYLSNDYKTYFSVSPFLNDVPTEAIITGEEERMMNYVREAFESTTGKEFPDDIKLKILSRGEMKEMHETNHGFWNDGIMGLSLNRKGFGMNHIFVRENELAPLMLTIGHEIGHVLSPSLENTKDEESKAFAFSMAWMKAVAEDNIAGLSTAINPNPARNGLHDKAFGFVVDLINEGREAIDVYFELAKRNISIESVI